MNVKRPSPAGDAGPALAPVDVVTGPGNVYVATAKRLVKSVVGIDAEAGTTEIAILADDSAVPAFVAADLVSQAEHDPHAASVLITPSTQLAEAVRAELALQVAGTKHADRVRQALSGPQSGVILVDDLEQGRQVCDAYAAEPFVHVGEAPPETKWATGSNAAFLTARHDERTNMVVAIAAIDNLGKGAAGQMIQCANLMLGLDETVGLPVAGVYP